jgi:hypothetical protein
MPDTLTSDGRDALDDRGFVHIPRSFARPHDAWSAAQELVDAAASTGDPLVVLADYVIPPLNGSPSRDFRTLHFDFGPPRAPAVPVDVARHTALHVPTDTLPSDAATRLVPLGALLAGTRWPDHQELAQRFATYGTTHGARDAAAGYIEGSLARILEAALGQTPVLPSVGTHPEFRCGTEFARLADETDFFAQRPANQ